VSRRGAGAAYTAARKRAKATAVIAELIAEREHRRPADLGKGRECTGVAVAYSAGGDRSLS
jgi:hypothetical protein